MTNRVIEHLFFFGILGLAAYVTWQIISPFVGALALAACQEPSGPRSGARQNATPLQPSARAW